MLSAEHRRNSRLVIRQILATARRTSIRLEPEFWQALDQICEREMVGRHELVRRIESTAGDTVRTSAVRVFVLEYFRTRAAGQAVLPRLLGPQQAGTGISKGVSEQALSSDGL